MDDYGRFTSLHSHPVCLEPNLVVIKAAPSKNSLSWRDLSTDDLSATSEEEEGFTDEEEKDWTHLTLPGDDRNSSSPFVADPKDYSMAPIGVAAPPMNAARASKPEVTLADVVKAARATSIKVEEEECEDLKTIFDYDSVQLCYEETSPEKARKSSKARAKILWQRAVGKSRVLKDPWKNFHLEEFPVEKALRHRYNASSGEWTTDEVMVKMDTQPFGNGAMRECFRLKKISNFTRPRTLSNADADLSTIDENSLWAGSAKNYVAKRYLDSPVQRNVYYDDVKLQMDAKIWGEEYNRHSPPKPVDIFQMSLLEFHERPQAPLFHLEHFIEGDYVKYNSNSGYINDKTLRRTPQAFSHFTFERSGHQLIVVDVQGVGDLYTDPQIHTVSGNDYGDGNLGTRGMALFFKSHACSRICRSLNLVLFDLSPEEKDEQQSLVANQKNCVTMLRGTEMPLLGGETSPLQTSVNNGPRYSTTSDEGYFELNSPKIRVESDSSASEREEHERFFVGDRSGSGRRRLDSSLCDDDVTMPNRNQLCPANLCHRGSSVAVEMTLLNALREKTEKKTSLSILGQIHLDLAKYHDQGRFREDSGRDEIDFGAILFHLEKATECCQLVAVKTLISILLNFPSDFISNPIPQRNIDKFLKGDDASSRGFSLLETAALAGDRWAMIRVGIAFEAGQGRSKSWVDAVQWFNRAVEMDECDEGGQFDSTLDIPLFDLLSRQAAMLSTGGFGLEADPSAAGDLYTAAAEAAVAAMKGRLANKFYMMAEESWALVEE